MPETFDGARNLLRVAGVPVGQSLNCPKCNHKFKVEAAEEADIVDETEVMEVIEDFTVDEPEPRVTLDSFILLPSSFIL